MPQSHPFPIGPAPAFSAHQSLDSQQRLASHQSPERKRRVARRPSTSPARQAFSIVAFLTFATPARADIDPLSGIDFARITHPGNAPWPGNGTINDRAIGRGGVDYEYNIGRFEVTTSQWAEFFNAAYDRPQSEWIPHLVPPDFWGAVATTPNTPGGRRWTVPAGNEMRPTGNISWRMAAIYCNWLHNGKTSNREAFLNGAYDVSTFGYFGDIFTDQAAHHPDARYWIPSWDEWLKAAHYDPHKDGPDQGGWWMYPHGSDSPLTYGPPGVIVNGQLAQANAGWDSGFPGYDPFAVPLGAYPDVMSPWGLLDVGGGTTEWTESIRTGTGLPPTRTVDGSAWVFGPLVADSITRAGSEFPSFSTFDHGLRIASSVPAPASVIVFLVAAAARRRRTH